MASPENTKDSPSSSYWNNLSPLKPDKARPIMQLYGDSPCPTPGLVFTSPHLNRQSSLLKRSNHPCFSGAKQDSSQATSSENDVITVLSTQMVKFFPCVVNKCNVDGSSQDQACSSPSTSVDVFLCDPLENSDKLSHSQNPHLEEASELSRDVSCDVFTVNENQVKSQKDDFGKAHVLVDESMANNTDHSISTCLSGLNSRQLMNPSNYLGSEINDTREIISDHQVPNVKACTTTKSAVSSSSLYEADKDLAREKSLIVHLDENESNEKMVDRATGTTDRLLDMKLKSVSKNASINADSSTEPAPNTQFDQSPVDHSAVDQASSISKDFDLGHEEENHNDTNFCHGTKDVRMPSAEIVQWHESDHTPQLLEGSVQHIHTSANHFLESGAISNTSSENCTPYYQEEAAQSQLGFCKRLEFEAIENCRISAGCEIDPWMLASDVSTNVGSPVTSLEVEIVNASNKEPITTLSNKQSVQSGTGNALCRVPCFGRNEGSLPVMVPKPLHIGLHLNSIGNASPLKVNTSMQSPDDNVCVQREKLISRSIGQEAQYPKNCLSSLSLIGQCSVEYCPSSDSFSPYIAENSEEEEEENQAIIVSISCDNYQASHDVRPLNNTPLLKPVDHYMTSHSMKRTLPEDARILSAERSPKKKRKMKKVHEKEDCRRCNCKKSKCLKLYCDCFAAGISCSKSCACQDCCNRPEHEDKIRETREQIMSRNPLAFAPKVISVSGPPKDSGAMEHKIPTSVRHKRGCNCKKSQCLKKYCECFQVGVGCSLGCRCEGCKNTFGRNEESGVISGIEHRKYEEIGSERHPSGTEAKRGSVNNEHYYSRLSPITPTFPVPNGSEAVRAHELHVSYYPSPESGASVSPNYQESPSSPVDSISSNPFASETAGTSSIFPYNQQLDSFSPGWDGFADLCSISPLPNPSPHNNSESEARVPRRLHAKLFGEGRLSSGTLQWHSSPITPQPQPPDSDKNHEDNILDVCPIKVVTMGSPNKKRVSPPRTHLAEAGSSSSPGIKNGRKFVLQAVPLFTPLTPYSNDSRCHEGT